MTVFLLICCKMTHTCHAIEILSPSLRLCRNLPKEDSLFCPLHQDISPQEHKQRWIQKFLLGADGKPFLYNYDEGKKYRILRDLQEEIVTLTSEDIKLLTQEHEYNQYMDVYVLLFQNGHLNASSCPDLYFKACSWLVKMHYEFYTPNTVTYTHLSRKILDYLILKDAEHVHLFLTRLPSILADLEKENLHTTTEKLSDLLVVILNSDAGTELCWQPFQNSLLQHYKHTLGLIHPAVQYLDQTYLPQFRQLYLTQKQYHKERIDALKEELMAMTWHPERFLEWCLDEEEKAETKALFA